jgi:hypothetical protein
MQQTQTYRCNHCGRRYKFTFDLFLHIFTDHLHKDQFLAPWQSKLLLAEYRPVGREIVVWEN